MDKHLAMAAAQDGFRRLCIRPSNPCGPGQNFRSAQGLVAVAMSCIARHETITIRGDGSATKDYLFIEDFADACVRLLSTAPASPPQQNRNQEQSTPNEERAQGAQPKTPNAEQGTSATPANPPSGCHSNILKNVGMMCSSPESDQSRSTDCKISGPFNIGSGRGATVLELLAAISQVVGKEPILDFQPAVTGDVQSNVLDCSKIRQATGWAPTTSLEEGLRRTWEWMKPQIFRRSAD